MSDWADPLGWLACGLMLATFSSVTARRLRLFAVAANLAFIAYGLTAHLPPVLALHLVLLPVNLVRLLQASRRSGRPTVRDRRPASTL
jgi:hypothetical protein